MDRKRLRLPVAALSCLVATACSASSGHDARSSAASRSVRAAASADPQVAVQHYVDAVDALCDALLPKVIAVTGGGSLDVPLKDYRAQLPAHTKLLAEFDRHVAAIAVPPEAEGKAAAFAAYVRFANRLDARRLAAANRGEAAYAKEIAAESDAAGDPTITARNAAGFADSCDAR